MLVKIEISDNADRGGPVNILTWDTLTNKVNLSDPNDPDVRPFLTGLRDLLSAIVGVSTGGATVRPAGPSDGDTEETA